MSSEKYIMVAKTFPGLENVLKEELIEIGASDVEVLVREVRFAGSKEILYKANFCCRTALKILVIIKEFKVKSANDLYNGVRGIEWFNYFDVQQTFSIISTVNSEAFNNSMIIGLKTKDAIIDVFKSKIGKRPSFNAENPDIRVNIHASADEVSISLDSSGESLHKRGYRIGQNETSMSEVLAAGILKIAGWKGQCDLYDTMCGSGTLPIEAALIARNIPPGIFRKSFSFEKWKDFDEALFDSVYNADYETPFEHAIYASDLVSVNVKIATENAKNAGLKKDIQFSVADFSSVKPVNDSGMLIINPPSGQRFNDRSIEPIFTMIGESLRNNFKGFKAWVISNFEEGFRSIGLKPSTRVPLFNGSIECELRCYEVFENSRRPSSPDFRQRDSRDRSNGRVEFRGQGRADFGGNRRERDYRSDGNSQNRSPRRSDDPRSRNSDSLNGRDFKTSERSNQSGLRRNNEVNKSRGNSDNYGSRPRSTDEPSKRNFKQNEAKGESGTVRKNAVKKIDSGEERTRRPRSTGAKTSEEPKRSFRKPDAE